MKLNQIKNCYLLYGEEEWIKNQWLSKIKNQTVGEDDLMNFNLFEGKDIEVSKIMDTCETMPFFSPYKLVIVKESGLFKTGKKDETQNLLKWLQSLPEYVVLVFLEKEIDKRNGLYKWIHTRYEAIECNCPEENQLISIVTNLAKQKRLDMNPAMIRYFVENMPKSMHYIMGEMEKLAGYCGEKNTSVTEESIKAVCIFSLEQRVFELLKEMSRKHTTEALAIYNRLIESKESPIGILVLIARQYRMLLQVKYLLRTNMQSNQIAKTVGVPLFVAKEMVEESKRFSFKQLESILDRCLQSDIAIKTGKMEQVKCIELLMIECIYSGEMQ